MKCFSPLSDETMKDHKVPNARSRELGKPLWSPEKPEIILLYTEHITQNDIKWKRGQRSHSITEHETGVHWDGAMRYGSHHQPSLKTTRWFASLRPRQKPQVVVCHLHLSKLACSHSQLMRIGALSGWICSGPHSNAHWKLTPQFAPDFLIPVCESTLSIPGL